MEDDPRYEVRDEKVEVLLRGIGKTLQKILADQGLTETYGFCWFLFSYGEKSKMFYISSAQREDMIEALKEFLRKQGETSLEPKA